MTTDWQTNPLATESCRYSFDDLYEARFGRIMAEAEKSWLYNLPQNDRNQIVSNWAKEVDWNIEDRLGTDQVVYTAFWKGGE